jgi:hypothetical protein
MESRDLPGFVREITTPHGLILAAEQSRHRSPKSHELYGDLHALDLIEDLDKVGLGEYADQVASRRPTLRSSLSNSSREVEATADSASVSIDADLLLDKIDKVFVALELHKRYNGRICVDEAVAILLRLNARLGREYSEREADALFKRIRDNTSSNESSGLADQDNTLDLEEFKKALFVNLI